LLQRLARSFAGAMEEMKGIGRVVAAVANPNRLVELISYSDGSWGVRRDGWMVGTWEPTEIPECIRTFAACGGVIDEVVMLRKSSRRRAAFWTASSMPLN
jgi:hypothetical protein